MADHTPAEVDRQLHGFMHYHRQIMKRFFSDCGLFNGHPFMLFLLRDNPGLTPAQLARQMNIAPASATISIKRMEAEGLLRREPDPHDGRVVHLYLTPQGEEMDDRCSRGKDFAVETTFRDFSPAELNTLSDLLTRMQRNLAHADVAEWRRYHSEEGAAASLIPDNRKDDSV